MNSYCFFFFSSLVIVKILEKQDELKEKCLIKRKQDLVSLKILKIPR